MDILGSMQITLPDALNLLQQSLSQVGSRAVRTSSDLLGAIATARQSATQSGAFVGAATMIGSAIGGPVGMVAGGVVSGLVAYCYTRGTYLPIPYTIYTRWAEFAQEIRNYFTLHNIINLGIFMIKLVQDSFFQGLLAIIGGYLAQLTSNRPAIEQQMDQ